MTFHVPEEARVKRGPLASDATYGQNGMFVVRGLLPRRELKCIASDGEGWEHVSVSLYRENTKTPTWAEMDYACRLFWDAEDAVMQIHPPRSTHVNDIAGCLHLWRPVGVAIPLPNPAFVGSHARMTEEEKEYHEYLKGLMGLR